MKNVFKILCIAVLTIQAYKATAQDKLDISASTDEINVLYVGLTNTIQFNVNHIPSEKLFVLFTDEDAKALDSNVFSINRISPNTYTLHMSRRWGNTVIAHLYKRVADSSVLIGNKRFKIRNVSRPIMELSSVPLQNHWDYLMNTPTLNTSIQGLVRKDFQYKILGYTFVLLAKDGPKKMSVSGNSLAPVKALLLSNNINKTDSAYYMFSDIKAAGPSGTVYLENFSNVLTNGKPAYQSLEDYYSKKMEQSFDFSKAIQNKLLQISLKIHTAAINGNIQPYRDQTLKSKYTRDTYAMNGSKLVVTMIPLNNDNSDDYRDTAFTIPLEETSMTPDLGYCFSVSALKKGYIRQDLFSIAPMYFERFPNGQSYNIPTGWFSYKEVLSVLGSEDIKFLEAYTWHKQLEPFGADNSSAYQSSLDELNESGTITYYRPNTGEKLGTALQEHWRNQLYKGFRENKFKLTMGFNKPISETEFKKSHTIRHDILMQDTAYPDDPEKLIEAYYDDVPDAFDSVYFVNKGNENFMQIEQKNSENVKYIYNVRLQDIKTLMNPQSYSLLEVLLNDNKQKLQKFTPK
jgi:hypothetical protein